jgi:hypothetical protein
MVSGEMVLMKGVCIRTLYNILGITSDDGCNSCVSLEIGVEEEKNHIVFREKTMLWHYRL